MLALRQVIEEACQKYACAHGYTMVTAPKPMRPIQKSLHDPGLLAQVAVSKYGDQIPLHRQESILHRRQIRDLLNRLNCFGLDANTTFQAGICSCLTFCRIPRHLRRAQ